MSDTLTPQLPNQRAARKVPTKKQKVDALHDFWEFVDLINFQGGRSRFSECHFELMEWYTSLDNYGKRVLVEMPRGHLKSTLLTVATSLWDIYINPNVRIFVGTATKPLAMSFIREIKQYLEDGFLQEHVWNSRPHIPGRLIPVMDKLGAQRRRQIDPSDESEAEDKKIIWRSDAIQVIRQYTLKEPTLTTGSIGAQVTGYHYDKLRLDDVVTLENSISPSKKERLENWIADLESVLDPEWLDTWLEKRLPKAAKFQADIGGHISVVGTRYANNDWYDQIETSAEDLQYHIYKKNIYANGADSSEGYIWPEKWNEQLEAKTRARLTTRRFASQYLNKILADEHSHLQMSYVQYIASTSVDQSPDGGVVVRVPGTDETTSIKLFMAVDPAAATNNWNDYTAMVVGGRDAKNRMFIVDGDMGRWPTSEIIRRMFLLADRWKLRAVHIEQVGGFVHLGGAVRMSMSKYRPIAVLDHKPKGNKEERILNGLEPMFRNQLIYFPLSLSSRKDILDQFDMFGSTGIHDDFPDAVEALHDIAKPIAPKTTNYLNKFKNRKYGGFR